MTDTRVSQLPIEVASQLSAAPLQVTQLAVEIASIQMALIRATQLAIEIATKRDPDPVVVPDPPGGGTIDPPGINPAAGLNLCAVEVPLAWLEIRPAGSSTIYRYAKVPINIDGFPKEPRVESFGRIQRALSGDAGDFRGVSVTSVLIDTDRVLRGLEDTDSLIGARVAYYISSEAAIRAALTPRRVFDGIITDTEPLGGLLFQIQAADYFASLMEEFAANHTFPQRVFTVADFPNIAYSSSNPDSGTERHGNPALIGKPVPLLYGLVSDESDGLDAVGRVPCQFVGRRYIPYYGNYWDEFVVCAHAVKQVQSVFFPIGPGLSTGPSVSARVKVTAADNPQSEILFPGTSFWNTVMGTTQTYVEYNGNRYTSIFGFGPRSTLARTGQTPLVANVAGIEDVGDSSGTLITSLHRQLLHLLVNFIFGNYSSGAWLAPPVVPGDLYSRINTASFEALATLSEQYVDGGFKGAFILGSKGEAFTFQELLRRAALSGGYDYGINKDGQLFASMVNPLATLNRAIRDVTDVIKQSFRARRRRDQLANTVKYRYAKRYVDPLPNPTPDEGIFLYPENVAPDTEFEIYDQVQSDATSVAKYGDRVFTLDLEMVSDPSTADALAALKLATLKDGPTIVGFTERLCGTSTELGARDTVTHFEGITSAGYVDRSLRCELHTLDPDALNVEKDYRDLAPIDYSGI